MSHTMMGIILIGSCVFTMVAGMLFGWLVAAHDVRKQIENGQLIVIVDE